MLFNGHSFILLIIVFNNNNIFSYKQLSKTNQVDMLEIFNQEF